MRKDFLLTLALLLPLTLIFWVYPLDVTVQAWFFAPQSCWCGAETPFWGFLYHYGIFIGYLWALAALVGIMLSYWFPARYLDWRKPALAMVFTVLVGPGILVNAVLKDHWGRARPRDLEMFGGKESYTAPWAWGQTDGGKSFPCGHCSMGFYMAVPYLFLRRQRPGLAYAFLALGLSFGFLLGIARMMGGGHFLSDVLWSGGLVWLTALAAYTLFRLDKPLVYKPLDKHLQKKQARRSTLAIGIALPVLTLALLLATPYISEKDFGQSREALRQNPAPSLQLRFEEGNFDIHLDTALALHYRVNAFGFPNSKMGPHWEAQKAELSIRKTGWFTEVRNAIALTLPANLGKPIDFETQKGKVFLTLPADSSALQLRLVVVQGDCQVKIPASADFYLQYEASALQSKLSPKFTQAGPRIFSRPQARLRLHVVLKKGTLFLE